MEKVVCQVQLIQTKTKNTKNSRLELIESNEQYSKHDIPFENKQFVISYLKESLELSTISDLPL